MRATNASREPAVQTASVIAASLALGSRAARSRSRTRICSPARRPICVSSGPAAYGGALQLRSSLSEDAAISVVISFVVLAISRR